MFNSKEEKLTEHNSVKTVIQQPKRYCLRDSTNNFNRYIKFAFWTVFSYMLYTSVSVIVNMSFIFVGGVLITLIGTLLVSLNSPEWLILAFSLFLGGTLAFFNFVVSLMIGIQTLRFWLSAKKEVWFPYAYVMNETPQNKVQVESISIIQPIIQ